MINKSCIVIELGKNLYDFCKDRASLLTRLSYFLYLGNYRITIEAYGTRIPKILLAYQKERVKPKIETTDNAFKITLPNLNYNERQ